MSSGNRDAPRPADPMACAILTVFAVAFTAMSKYIRNAGAFYS